MAIKMKIVVVKKIPKAILFNGNKGFDTEG